MMFNKQELNNVLLKYYIEPTYTPLLIKLRNIIYKNKDITTPFNFNYKTYNKILLTQPLLPGNPIPLNKALQAEFREIENQVDDYYKQFYILRSYINKLFTSIQTPIFDFVELIPDHVVNKIWIDQENILVCNPKRTPMEILGCDCKVAEHDKFLTYLAKFDIDSLLN